MTLTASRRSYLAFAFLALAVYAMDSAALRIVTDPSRRMFVASGAACDAVFVVAALYYGCWCGPAFGPFGA